MRTVEGLSLGASPNGASKAEVSILNKGTDWSAGELASSQLTLNVAGHKGDIHDGTSAAPVEIVKPTLKVSRKEKITVAAISAITGNPASDGAAGVSALHGTSMGMAGSEAQAVGVFGGATNESNAEGENVEPDAAGGYFFGRITGGTSTKASAYGVVAAARRDVASAIISGVEIESLNFTATAESYQVAGSAPGGKARGIWMVAGGESDSSVGIVIDNPFGFQFDVGIAAGASVGGGKTGAIKSAFIRDDSHGERSIQIKGTHAKGAITVASGAGGIFIGEEEAANASALLEVFGGNESHDPLYVFRVTGSNNIRGQLATNGSGNVSAFAAGGTNSIVTGTVLGDSGLSFAAGKILHLGAAGKTSMVRVSESGVGFNGVTPVAKAAAITSPAATAESLKTAVDAIRVALTNVGITA
jgi:hypothetical protein